MTRAWIKPLNGWPEALQGKELPRSETRRLPFVIMPGNVARFLLAGLITNCPVPGVKVMLAFGKLPPARRTPLIDRAIEKGVEFLLGVDPAEAAYPNGWSDKPSGNWWKFGFPVFYVTDLLQNVEALVRLGCEADPRLSNALDLIRNKQDANGRWALEYDYAGKT